MTRRPTRRSDRWVTPPVVVTGILCCTVVVLGVAYLVADLVARGLDPAPVLQLAGTAATALGSTATLVLQLVGRRTAARTERSAGLVASAHAAGMVEVRPGTPDSPPANNTTVPAAGELVAGAVLAEQTMWMPAVPPPARRRPAHGEWDGRERRQRPRGDGSE